MRKTFAKRSGLCGTLGEGPLAKQLGSLNREVAHELQPGKENGAVGKGQAPRNVSATPTLPSWVTMMPTLLGELAGTLTGTVLALVLLAFMLIHREDLRNRVILLWGDGSLTTATRIIDDASQRISRYLLAQLLINGIVALLLSAGLLALGLPYAFLWGFSAFVLRYIPYVGIWVAALPPILLSLAMFEGWMKPLLVIGLFLLVEGTVGNVIEPRLYGRSIGVSEVAFLIAAAFGASIGDRSASCFPARRSSAWWCWASTCRG